MKYLTLIIIFSLWFIKGHACAISPFYQIVTDPEKYIKKSNAVFFGQLIGISDTGDSTQVAEFKVIEIFKGKLNTKIRIVNEIKTNCSSKFSSIGSHYYVFGNLTNNDSEIIMDGFPGFVAESYANKMNLINQIHSIILSKQ